MHCIYAQIPMNLPNKASNPTPSTFCWNKKRDLFLHITRIPILRIKGKVCTYPSNVFDLNPVAIGYFVYQPTSWVRCLRHSPWQPTSPQHNRATQPVGEAVLAFPFRGPLVPTIGSNLSITYPISESVTVIHLA